MDKLVSRKLIVAVITALIAGLGPQLGMLPGTIDNLVVIATTYILGQGAVDAATAFKSKSTQIAAANQPGV